MSWPGGAAAAPGLGVSDAERRCQSSRECVMVRTRCSDCDCGTAVNERFAARHERNLSAVCADRGKAACDSRCPAVEPTCIMGICALVPVRGGALAPR